MQTHVLSDEELSQVTGGGLIELNIAVVPQTVVANQIVVVAFSTDTNVKVGNNVASTWLSLKQLNLGN